MRCAFVSTLAGRYPIGELCDALSIGRSTYYGWQHRPPSRRHVTDALLLRLIRQIHQESRGTYGSPRIQLELRELGHRVARKRVARLMREHGLRARHFIRYKHTTQSGHRLPVAPNVLDRRFTIAQPNTVWAGDITYLWTCEGWVYLAVILDLCSRRVVGWSMRSRITKGLVVDALRKALGQRRPSRGLVYHSDRGSQYASNDYQMLLGRHGVRASMSGKGNCYDNAVVEAFFASLKRELTHGKRYVNREDAYREVFDYIEVFYNRKRRHSSIGGLSPDEFEKRLKCA